MTLERSCRTPTFLLHDHDDDGNFDGHFYDDDHDVNDDRYDDDEMLISAYNCL